MTAASHADRPEPLALLASLACLMTRYAETGCPRLARLVERELHILRQLAPEHPLLGPAACQLLRRWQGIGVPAAGATLH
jgi:hypothetical protein